MQYNANNPAIKRILKELKDMERRPSPFYVARPSDENLFDWHFTILGPTETDFEGGRYHGRIILPAEYPFKPPSIMLLNPNGRFQLHTKICLSITGYHPEFWQPAWSVATVLTALISFFPTPAEGAIGGLDTPSATRKALAQKSHEWTCSTCSETLGKIVFTEKTDENKITEADQEFLSLVAFRPESKKTEDSTPAPSTSTTKSPIEDNTALELPKDSPAPVAVALQPVSRRPSPIIDLFIFLSLGGIAILLYTK
ncbi:Ubiquitin-conjugating enzyme E2 J1 [Entomophthora muscae]|uniref:Ubiquitin-conjugating enzyme E2 J1 n=1 Tax=Entomophthora muscae TaxID=34485 RepID=A0ACC2S7W8_9FUNG|nr:Ubiquitin-conjugating enzyme E2 J1 [Entomophthora muscae]